MGDSTLHTDASGTAPPDAFGPFRVLHQIGVGVLGPVYRAYQPDPGRLVAVKLFRIDLQPDLAVRFVASLEHLISSDLTHMGIAAPLASGVVDGSPYLALDFVAAESFDVVVRDYGPAPATEALRIATQLGGALDFAAAVNVLHGSLHPRDVLVSTDDTRVTGLGIGQALEAVGITSPLRRPYTAPERIAGQTWDRRADVFSLAALVTEMLCGRRLSGTGTSAAEAIPEIDGASMDELRTVIARALADDPTDRYDTALAFVEGLHGAFVRPSTRPTPPRRRKRDADPLRPRPTPASPEPTPPALPLVLGSESAPDEETPVAAPDTASTTVPRAADSQLPTPALDEFPSEADNPESPGGAAIDLGAERATEQGHRVLGREDAGPVASPVEGRVDDVDLRQAEAERYTSVESAPAVPGLLNVAHLDLPTSDTPHVSAPPDATSAREAKARESEAVHVPLPEPVRESPPDPMTMPSARAAGVPEEAPRELATLSGAAPADSRSAVWPIVLALIVGGMVGFAFGFGAGSRDRNAQIPVQAQRDAPPSAPVSQSEQSAPSPSQPPDGSATPAAPRGAAAAGSGQAARAPEHTTPDSRDRERTRPAPTERSAADVGRLLVRSSPGGATVSLDGRAVGTTPLTLRDVAVGTHVLRFTHQGYVAAEQRVRISAAQPAQSIEVELVAARAERPAAQAPGPADRTSGLPAAAPAAKAGSLIVDSRPTGARVLVDGKLVGTTPFLLEDVAVGDHTVRLELDGFAPWTTSTHVSGGDRTRVSGSLEQK